MREQCVGFLENVYFQVAVVWLYDRSAHDLAEFFHIVFPVALRLDEDNIGMTVMLDIAAGSALSSGEAFAEKQLGDIQRERLFSAPLVTR